MLSAQVRDCFVEQHLPFQKDAIRILYLDDDAVDHKLMSLILQRLRGAERYDLSCVSKIDQARAALDTNEFDIFVLDNRMPSSPDFHATLSEIGEINPNIKIVVVSSEVDSDVFKNFDDLERHPDAVIEKANLRSSLRAGLFSNL